jgi:hypothetical protein
MHVVQLKIKLVFQIRMHLFMLQCNYSLFPNAFVHDASLLIAYGAILLSFTSFRIGSSWFFHHSSVFWYTRSSLIGECRAYWHFYGGTLWYEHNNLCSSGVSSFLSHSFYYIHTICTPLFQLRLWYHIGREPHIL